MVLYENLLIHGFIMYYVQRLGKGRVFYRNFRTYINILSSIFISSVSETFYDFCSFFSFFHRVVPSTDVKIKVDLCLLAFS